MDPITGTGLVLGIIPLLISAAENYEVTFQPFVTYCRHVKEIREFTTRLDAQHTIFMNECQLLLLEVDRDLEDILGDPNHSARADDRLSTQLQQLLGNSYKTCVSTLALIKDKLREIDRETAGFREVLERKKDDGKSGWHLFRQKVKISFGKTRLNSIADELKRHNEVLARLSGQIGRLKSFSPHLIGKLTSKETISDIETTHKAAVRLYDILSSRWSCDSRVEHVAMMSLEVENYCQNSLFKVRFNLAVTCKRAMVLSTPFCLAIESAVGETPMDSELSLSPVPNLQVALQDIGALNRKVRYAIPTPESSGLWGNLTTSTASPNPEPQTNLYTIGRLCSYLRESNIQGKDGMCIGFLEKSKTFRHYVYPVQPRTLISNMSHTGSLKNFLQTISTRGMKYDWVEKLRLAKLLALAVLHFHSTPWLSDSWSSSELTLPHFDSLKIQPSGVLENPLIGIPLTDAPTKQVEPMTGASSLASNQSLFNLGVVLIELGYDNTFENLAEALSDKEQSTNGKASGTQNNTRDRGADFIAARRLGESINRQMNMTYERIVEKCLNCNFGVATKLDNVELQSAVLIHVVNQLDVCLDQWRAFNKLSPCPPSPDGR